MKMKKITMVMVMFFAVSALAGNLERVDYSKHPNFRDRVDYSMMAAAFIVMSEDPSIPFHEQRAAFAVRVKENDYNKNTISLAVATNGTIGAKIDLVMASAAWQASTAYGAGASVTNLAANGFRYVSGGGTSDITEPVWTTIIGDTVTDGSIVWTCDGPTDSDIQYVVQTEMWNSFSGVVTVAE